MFNKREEIRERIAELVAKFRAKYATTPEKALTARELGLTPLFQKATHQRLGRSGIFGEVNGKYYLSEERHTEV